MVTEPITHLNNRYTGSVYIGVATSEIVVASALMSIRDMQRRPGDSAINVYQHTKGMDARESHVETFLESKHDFILFLDGDMYIPVDALERLRAHGFPCVTGHYLRRTYHMPIPIWYEEDREENWQYRWPMMPFRLNPEKGQLYRLGACGFGCWLIHREVLEKVQEVLCGERFVWEHHMAFWPETIANLVSGTPPRPLRLAYDTQGADLRLGFFIRHCGYPIWGDPAVDCGHFVNYPLTLADRQRGPAFDKGFAETTTEEIGQIRERHQQAAAIARGVDRDRQ